ncbi:Hpt domain-containing protein [Chelativorans xinjiangense]|uniref:Hpt domain-containing protein n=1 Tax=Chelativorans xinjiangense TaxID=2681485 RepID=UPI0013572235|nr:Hpt domain-containing protein [Chelativorans xinjiangense]
MLDRQRHPAPIDRTHLARQTQGDAGLQREVLQLFLAQAVSVRGELASADAETRHRLAHCLVGSARAVGAFALADCAAALEAAPHSAALADRLAFLIEEMQAFAAELLT